MEHVAMRRTNPARWRWCLLLSFIISCGAWAGDSAMLELLKVLRDNGTINESAYMSLLAAARKETAQNCAPLATSDKPAGVRPPAKVAAGAPVKQAASGKTATARVGPVEVELGGRIQMDVASYQSESGTDFGSGAEVRRARFELDGTAGRDWAFRTTVEFADSADLKTAYFKYLGWEDNELLIGKHRESILLDEVTSSKYTTFMERAMITEFHPGRNPGFGWRLLGSRTYGQLGLFFSDVDEVADDQVGLTGRAVWTPVRDKRNVVHLGMAGSTRDIPQGSELRFRARPESHVTDVRLIDTGALSGINRHDMLGLEAAWVNGPWSAQAEYLFNWLRRDNMATLQFGGWYAYLSWFATGESRRYRPERAAFGRIKPKRPLNAGGLGAWELAARFSHLDLTDKEIIGGSEDNLTFGLNWYPTGNTRFTFNVVKVLEVDRPGDASDGVEPSIFQVRAQVHF